MVSPLDRRKNKQTNKQTKKLPEKIIPTWRIKKEKKKHHSDRGIHFAGQVLKTVCRIWPVLRFYCTYYLQSSGLVKCTNGTIKTQQSQR